MNKPYPKPTRKTLPNEPLDIEVTHAGYDAALFTELTPIDLTDLDASIATLEAVIAAYCTH